MFRGKDIIGSAVVAGAEFARVARVCALVVDPEGVHVLAFLVERGGWQGRARVLPWTEVVEVGWGRVTAQSPASIVDASTVDGIQAALEQENQLQGAPVYLIEGGRLGRLIDFYFDEQSGEIEGYDIWQGQTLNAVRFFLPASSRVGVRDSALHFSSAALHLMNKSTVYNEQRALLGRYVLWDIRSARGHLVAAQGQVITEKVLRYAHMHDRLPDLWQAVDIAEDPTFDAVPQRVFTSVYSGHPESDGIPEYPDT